MRAEGLWEGSVALFFVFGETPGFRCSYLLGTPLVPVSKSSSVCKPVSAVFRNRLFKRGHRVCSLSVIFSSASFRSGEPERHAVCFILKGHSRPHAHGVLSPPFSSRGKFAEPGFHTPSRQLQPAPSGLGVASLFPATASTCLVGIGGDPGPRGPCTGDTRAPGPSQNRVRTHRFLFLPLPVASESLSTVPVGGHDGRSSCRSCQGCGVGGQGGGPVGLPSTGACPRDRRARSQRSRVSRAVQGQRPLLGAQP